MTCLINITCYGWHDLTCLPNTNNLLIAILVFYTMYTLQLNSKQNLQQQKYNHNHKFKGGLEKMKLDEKICLYSSSFKG